MNKFASSDTIKNLHDVRGGSVDPVYTGWSDTGNGADEELITKNGTGDCDGFYVGNANCIDETYDCGGIVSTGGGSASGNAAGIAG